MTITPSLREGIEESGQLFHRVGPHVVQDDDGVVEFLDLAARRVDPADRVLPVAGTQFHSSTE